jgi:hypothetical protein
MELIFGLLPPLWWKLQLAGPPSAELMLSSKQGRRQAKLELIETGPA